MLLIHGSIEDSRIFHSKSGKGFGPFLAEAGYDVFAPDLAGKGGSRPKIKRGFAHSQADFLERDMNIYADAIAKLHPGKALRLGAHSWGGVLLLAWMARYAGGRALGPGVFFASKRRIGVMSLRRLFMVDVVWTLGGLGATALKGYLPAKKMGMGSENEPADFYKEVNRWVYSPQWKDPVDGFDYAAALRKMELPPLLFFAGKADKVLGHPKDVKRLMKESGSNKASYVLLSKENGFQRDYGHIDLLTAPQCREDHFGTALKFLKEGAI